MTRSLGSAADKAIAAEPARSYDFEVSEVGLPELVGRHRLVLERLGSRDDDESRTGDQVIRLEQAIARSF